MKKTLPILCAIFLLQNNLLGTENLQETISAADILTTENFNTSIKREGIGRAKQEAVPLNEDKMRCLIAAYRTYISKIERKKTTGEIYFHMSNGQVIQWQDNPNKTFEEKLASPSLADMFSQDYLTNQDILKAPRFNQDPGRFRNSAFFQSIYGDTSSAVEQNLVKIPWLPNTTKQLGGKPSYLLFNTQNGAAAALRKVSHALDELPLSLKTYVLSPAGTFSWRNIAGTNRYSPHSYGIAIDINTTQSNYWRWDHKDHLDNKHFQYQNRIPAKIVSIFESHGFIWGGRWYHYDTMHFEYRPEFFQHKQAEYVTNVS